uniref:Uncharacterized protein n=3 Tax=Enterobacteriaceae TaxID=543 RepID=A0A2S1JDW3_ECOLX|nr:hypothetical protein [Escherichia coli]AYU66148.1 hypothetical protein [Citrobacter freundii]QIQ12865.1 hypothetical protein [Klebsiella pneumoniae]UFD95273.1 hypothetical protein [Escherichia coli]
MKTAAERQYAHVNRQILLVEIAQEISDQRINQRGTSVVILNFQSSNMQAQVAHGAG